MAAPNDVRSVLTINRSLPTPAQPEGQPLAGNPRASRYGEHVFLQKGAPWQSEAADEGSYFLATNPTPGTAIAYSIQTTFSDTLPYLLFRNNAIISDPTPKRIILDYLKLICTTAPASATSARFACKTDGPSSNRYGSGGTLITPISPNTDMSVASVINGGGTSSMFAGTITANAASTAARLTAMGSLSGVLMAAGDEYLIKFASPDGGSAVRGATASTRLVTVAPPQVIGPQSYWTFHPWFPANAVTAPQFEFELGYFER